MFNFLGNHPLWESVVRGAYTRGHGPRPPENARLAAVCTAVLGVLLIALGLWIALAGNQWIGYVFIAIAIVAMVVNFVRAR